MNVQFLGEIPADKVWLFEINGFRCETKDVSQNIKIEQKTYCELCGKAYVQNTQDKNLDTRGAEVCLFKSTKQDLSTESE